MRYATGANASHKATFGGVEQTKPQAYWRTLEAPQYDTVHRLQLSCLLGSVHASDALWRRALGCDPSAAVAIALTMRIPTVVTYPIDLRMSVLLGASLGGNAACALVMSHMLLRMPIETNLRTRLSKSWSLHRAEPSAAVVDPDNFIGGDR